MSNTTFHRLWNEWHTNLGANPILEEYIRESGIPAYEYNEYSPKITTDQIKAARDYCRKEGLCWKNSDEMDRWLDMATA